MSIKSTTPDRCRLPSALWKALDREGLSVTEALRRARLPAMLRLQSSHDGPVFRPVARRRGFV